MQAMILKNTHKLTCLTGCGEFLLHGDELYSVWVEGTGAAVDLCEGCVWRGAWR